MTFGPDGNLYVSNFGFGAPPGLGQVVRIDLGPAAPGLSQSIAGPFTATADSGPNSPSPVPISAHGLPAGNFAATYDFTMLTPQPSSDPTTQPPAASAGVTSPALPFSPAPLPVLPLTSNLPPAGPADSFQPAWASEAADRVFASLDAELSLALFVDGLAVPPRN
jgi:hypothetical protein